MYSLLTPGTSIKIGSDRLPLSPSHFLGESLHHDSVLNVHFLYRFFIAPKTLKITGNHSLETCQIIQHSRLIYDIKQGFNTYS